MTFSDQAIETLRAEARRLGISVSDLLRRIVDQWIDRQEAVAESDDGLSSWERYDRWLDGAPP